jgi:hypothetical protein
MKKIRKNIWKNYLGLKYGKSLKLSFRRLRICLHDVKQAQCNCYYCKRDACQHRWCPIAEICGATVGSGSVTTSRGWFSRRRAGSWNTPRNRIRVACGHGFLQNKRVIQQNATQKSRTTQRAVDSLSETCVTPAPFELKDVPQPSVPAPHM